MLALIPTRAKEAAYVTGEFLLAIDPEAILQGGVFWMVVDFRGRSFAFKEIVDRHPIVAHVGVISEREQSKRGVSSLDEFGPQLELEILRMRSLQIDRKSV